MTIKTINEERLFQKLPFFFSRPSNVLIELAQNAERAGAATLDIALEGRTLTVRDDGRGAANPQALFVLADSDWAEQVESQNPAGWGLYFILCLSESLTYRSRFGSITVDCEKYLSSVFYRANVLDLINAHDSCDGFFLSAVLKKNVEKTLLNDIRALRFFPFDITVNGKSVEKGDLASEAHYGKERSPMASPVIKTSYEGNDVFIEVTKYLYTSPAAMAQQMRVVWYGIPIEGGSSIYVFVDVKTGSPLTPVLPYRTSVREDEKLAAFCNFVRKAVVEYCTGQINDRAVGDEDALVGLMETMGSLATQDELDCLNRYFVKIGQPYFWADYGVTFNKVVSRVDPPLVNEIVKEIVLTGLSKKPFHVGFSDSPDDLVVPEGLFISAEKPGKSPSWLNTKDREYTIEIAGEQAQSQNYRWIKAAEIKCEGKDLAVLATVEGSCCGTIIYANSPEAVYEIEDAIFQAHILVEDFDVDTPDTQRDYFARELAEDIMKVTGAFRKRDLLSGISIIGVNASDVRSIVFRKASAVIKLVNGGTKTIKLAA